MPRVSAVITTHNRREMLKRAIDSVLKQTFQDFEIIVVDDGNESAEDVVKSFSETRMRYLRNERPHMGAPVARNVGIKSSQGEFVAFLDDDDEWLPLKLELQVKALDENPEADFCFCSHEAVDKNGKFLYFKKFKKEGVFEPYLDLLNRSFAWTSSILARKDLFDRGFLFDESLLKNQEWDLALRMAKAGVKFYSINQVLYRSHIHGNQLGGSNNLTNRIVGHHIFIQKYFSDYQKHPDLLARRYEELALIHKEGKQQIKSLAYFAKAFATYPSMKYMRGFASVLVGRFLKRILKKA